MLSLGIDLHFYLHRYVQNQHFFGSACLISCCHDGIWLITLTSPRFEADQVFASVFFYRTTVLFVSICLLFVYCLLFTAVKLKIRFNGIFRPEKGKNRKNNEKLLEISGVSTYVPFMLPVIQTLVLGGIRTYL